LRRLLQPPLLIPSHLTLCHLNW